MLTKLDEAKADLLARAVEAGERGPEAAHVSDLGSFLSRYYQYVAAEDLLGRAPSDVLGAALSHRAWQASGRPARRRVRVYTPTVEAHGWASGHTVVEVVTDDMPFLVDSVASGLSQEGLSVHLVIHPQVVVRRSSTGELLEVVPAAQVDHDTAVEHRRRGCTWRSTGSPTRPSCTGLERTAR